MKLFQNQKRVIQMTFTMLDPNVRPCAADSDSYCYDARVQGTGALSGIVHGIVGVKQTGVAWSTFTVQPLLATLKFVNATVPTIRGPIVVAATPERVAVRVPCNTQAILCVSSGLDDGGGAALGQAEVGLLLDGLPVASRRTEQHLCTQAPVGCAASARVVSRSVLSTVSAALPMPSRLMVEYLPEPASGSGDLLTISTLRPRFSFVPHAQHEHPGSGVAMRAYHIIVESVPPGRGGWDSGVVPATAAVGITCGAELKSLTSYSWTAQWYATGEQAPSPNATGSFTVGPGEADWGDSKWLGGGHTEFRYKFSTGAAKKLFVAAPGGAVVYANGKPATDECGVSAWINYDANMPYIGVDLAPFLTVDAAGSSTQTVVIRVGSGFYSGSKWRPKPSPAGGSSAGRAMQHPAARLLLVDGHGLPAVATLSGRVGGIVSSDPFVGGVFDTTLSAEAGWEHTRAINDTKVAQLDGPLRAFTQPPAKTAPDAAAALRSTVVTVSELPPAPAPSRCRTHCDPMTPESLNKTICHGQPPEEGGCDPVTAPQRQWHYGFSRNIVGIVAIEPSAYKLKPTAKQGEITVQYCEVFNSTTYTKQRSPTQPFPQWKPAGPLGTLCQPLAFLSVVADTYLLGPTSGGTLRPSFTWHGFQHIIISVSDSVVFDPSPSSVRAEWTTTNAEATGSIAFGGGKDAEMLNEIRGIVQAGQLSNMAAFVPTDCPTREKHAWLGDGMDVAEEALYNFAAAPMYELFLDTIRANQHNVTGNLPMNVPAAIPGNPSDISWTAAYPLISNWLLLYCGDIGVVREHWPTLKLFVDGEKQQMASKCRSRCTPDGIPNYWSCGDWCAVESRALATPNTGPPAAAANFVLALEAMVVMADALGEKEDQDKYSSWLESYRTMYDQIYWNSSFTSYGLTALETQTMSSVALGAGIVPSAKETTVRHALTADIQERDHHLTVGATGQKWLLRMLTAGSAAEHDTALKVATQDTFPGWGYWVRQGATTCWESWSGVQDASHPAAGGGRPINPPTHNRETDPTTDSCVVE
jgi:hypothetical protein